MIFFKVITEVWIPIALITIALNVTIVLFESTGSLALSLVFLNGMLLILGVYQLALIRVAFKGST